MTKARTNIYLDAKLKEQAKAFFQSYGLNLSSGISFLLKQTLEKKSMKFEDEAIEPVYPDDPDYKLMQETKKGDTISLDEFMKL